MSANLRKLIIILGVALLIGGGYVAWRATHPPLSNEQQIVANVEGIRAAVERRHTNGVMGYLAPDFSWSGANRDELRSHLIGAFMQSRDVQLHVSDLKVKVEGNHATSTGSYSASFRRTQTAPPEIYAGKFHLYWEQRDGNWQVVRAEGGEEIGDR